MLQPHEYAGRYPKLLDWLRRVCAFMLLLICSGSMLLCAQEKIPVGIIDYHQHLYSPESGGRSSPGPKGIDADHLVAQLDVVGIQRAVVFSVAYSFSNPNKPPVPDEYAHVCCRERLDQCPSCEIPRPPDRFLQRESAEAIRNKRDCSLCEGRKSPHRSQASLREF